MLAANSLVMASPSGGVLLTGGSNRSAPAKTDYTPKLVTVQLVTRCRLNLLSCICDQASEHIFPMLLGITIRLLRLPWYPIANSNALLHLARLSNHVLSCSL